MNGKKILLVDDDMAFIEMLSEILTAEGATVITEIDGESGINRAFKEKPDLVVFDVMMPRMTGVAALEMLRKDNWGKNVPALLLTNVNEPETMAASMENGPPTEYLLKVDWTLEQIADRIKKVLERVT
jgi:CheY-like chemotaxis protein